MFTDPDQHGGQFTEYIKNRFAMQWGGLSDPFDNNERRLGVSLELLKFFRDIQYPICFSTKGTWWVNDKRYVDAFTGGKFNVKFSVITLDENKAREIEIGVPTPAERLRAMHTASRFVEGGVTLRLRPFIIGVSNPLHVRLVEQAAACGATAVSTEFMCLEGRLPQCIIDTRFGRISHVIGHDVWAFYKQNSDVKSGYMRLSRKVKLPFIKDMQEACKRTGLRFYVSDQHFKERCDNGSCCGLPESWKYSRGQWCEALQIAYHNGSVRWSAIAPDLASYAKSFSFKDAAGYNQGRSETRARFATFSMYDFLHWSWNNPKYSHSPSTMFAGILAPLPDLDGAGNVVYKWIAPK